ncbi:hypothetical protein WJX72_000776 [[Myrmecia] bisecta]|uniref:UspA domain-containing protein n=1 Tax=[Myrmecia] bisecta TaxID=41462 RepID=A0AAW1PR68_9CHLO
MEKAAPTSPAALPEHQAAATCAEAETSDQTPFSTTDVQPVYTVRAAFVRHATGEEATLPVAKLGDLLADLGLSPAADTLQTIIQSVAPAVDTLTLDETRGICGTLSSQRPSTSASHHSTTSLATDKALSQRRSYSCSGWLAQDEAVLAYMKKLEEHRKRCERDGKYLEAKATCQRLADLKMQEAMRMRQAILDRQAHEITIAEAAFAADKLRLQQIWVQQLQQYDDSVTRQVEALRQKHILEDEANVCQLEARRPVKPRSSKELLAQRRVTGLLAKQGMYNQAAKVKKASDRLEAAEMKSTLASFEAELKTKQAKLHMKQRQEMQVLADKGARGREEMQRLHKEELQRRRQRLRNLTAELTNLQKLEVVHLEHFMESQAKAGKHKPLPTSGFRKPAADILHSRAETFAPLSRCIGLNRSRCARLADSQGRATSSSSASTSSPTVNVYEATADEVLVPKNLVIAIDRTSDAREAVQWALQHVASPDDTIHLLNVISDPRSSEITVGATSAGDQWDPTRASDYSTRKSWISKLEKDARAAVKQDFLPLFKSAKVHVEINIVKATGPKSAAGIGQAICDKTQELSGSLLFIASHGTGVLADYGSVAKYCSEHARAPVLMLPPRVGQLKDSSPGQLLVVGLDDLHGLEAAIAFSLRNLYRPGDHVHTIFMQGSSQLAAEDVKQVVDRAFARNTSGKVDQHLEVLSPKEQRGDVLSDSEFGQDVCDRADKTQARAVVLLHHGKGLAQEMIFGSFTSYCTRNCKRPLVVFRE